MEQYTQEEQIGVKPTQKYSKKEILSGAGKLVLFVLLPAAAICLMEAYEHNPFAEVRPKALMFNFLLFELIAWILFLLTNGMRLAIRIELGLAMSFGLVNHYVMLFRSTPLVPCDIYSIGTAVSVTDNYDFTPGVRVIWVSIGFAALFVLAHVLKNPPRIRLPIRLPATAMAAAVLCIFTNALQSESFQLKHYLYPYLFTPAYMTKVNGMAVTFAMNLKYLTVQKPKGYNQKEAQELLASYEGETDPVRSEAPNLIVIMDEAFSDLAVLGEVATNIDYMPFYHELEQGRDNTVTGYAQVSVCGGNTANSEFEFLTGNTMAFLPNGSIPYQQYMNGELLSLASHLSGLGYQTCAQHPYYAGGWKRDEVYPRLGFAEMHFLNDYHPKRYVRNYISDECDFAHVIATYEQKKPGSPVFLFNVTMQNHGGYTTEYDNFTNEVWMEDGSAALNQYLSLVRRTDESLQRLIGYFEAVEEPTVVVFFGDHQPADSVVRPVWRANGVNSQALNEAQQLARYQVPYLIWANFDIPEGTGINTSLNYLAGHVLELAGVPRSAYQNFLAELEEVCPIISAVGRSIAPEAAEEELAKSLLTYQKLQYFQIFDYSE